MTKNANVIIHSQRQRLTIPSHSFLCFYPFEGVQHLLPGGLQQPLCWPFTFHSKIFLVHFQNGNQTCFPENMCFRYVTSLIRNLRYRHLLLHQSPKCLPLHPHHHLTLLSLHTTPVIWFPRGPCLCSDSLPCSLTSSTLLIYILPSLRLGSTLLPL